MTCPWSASSTSTPDPDHTCKECDGSSSVCKHGRIRSACKECGGTSLCEHGRRRSRCKKCGGSSFCEHGRRRTECKECGGGSICEHRRQRSKCKECGGSDFCEHGRRRSRCKECGRGDHVIILEATAVEGADEEGKPHEWCSTVQAHIVTPVGPQNGKRKLGSTSPLPPPPPPPPPSGLELLGEAIGKRPMLRRLDLS